MKEFWNTIQLIFTVIGGWLGWFLGGCDGLLYALIAFVAIDYITGVMCAVIDHRLSSDVGRILRTFKIKKNVEVTDNGKDDF